MNKILLLTPAYDEPHRTMGSAPKIARQLAKHSQVVVVSGGTSDRIEQRSENLRVYFIKEWLIPDPVNNGPVPLMITKIKNILEEENPDVILNLKHMFYINLAVLWLKKQGYKVITATDAFPGYDWWAASKITNSVMWGYARTLGKIVLKKSDKVVLFHEGLVSRAKKLGLNYEVIPNGVEYELINKARKKRLKGEKNLLYVGRLESVKGYETILKAAKKITQQNPGIHFYHLGDLKGKDQVVNKYSSKQIHFEGRKSLSEVYSYMKGADIVLLASKSEGLPNVIMEGMACGCVPVSTPVGAVPDLLEYGKLGGLFAYGDVDDLSNKITLLLSDEITLKKLSFKCKEKIRKEYDWEKLALKYLIALKKS